MDQTNHVPERPEDLLEAETIALLLPNAVRHGFDLRVVESTGSTSSDLLAGAGTLPSGSVLAAEYQTAGRGRRGRTWVAPPGGSLAFSILWKFDAPPAALAGLSLAVGVAVARAADACGTAGLKLKWPNDLIAWRAAAAAEGDTTATDETSSSQTNRANTEGVWAKAGGILVELGGAGNSAANVAANFAINGAATGHAGCYAVIGIGLNVALGDAIRGIDQAATDFATLGLRASRNRLLAACLEELLPILRGFGSTGFAPFADEWNRRHAWQDQALVLSGEAAAPLSGIARGVDANGALLFETNTGLQRIISGEFSLRTASP